MRYGILNKPKHGEEYGITRYWAEYDVESDDSDDSDVVRIEFNLTEILRKEQWEQFPEQFQPLFTYITSLLIKSYMTDEEYERVVARRTAAGKQAIEEKIRSGKG